MVPDRLRLVLGFILAPLLPVLAAALLGWLTPGRKPGGAIDLLLFLAEWSLLFSVPATLFFALPLFLWFRRRGWLRLGHALAAGALVGLASAGVVALYSLLSSDGLSLNWRGFKSGFSYAEAFVPSGLLMGGIFWMVAFWRAKRAPLA